MSNNSILVTYNGTHIIIEYGSQIVELPKKEALALRNILSEYDNMYNLSGRQLTDKEWNELSNFHSDCQKLESGQSKFYRFNDKDKEIAFLNMFGGESRFIIHNEDGLITIVKTPF